MTRSATLPCWSSDIGCTQAGSWHPVGTCCPQLLDPLDQDSHPDSYHVPGVDRELETATAWSVLLQLGDPSIRSFVSVSSR